MKVEVAYAGRDRQEILAVEVKEGSTIETAIQQSGILALFPEIDLAKQKVGVFSKQKDLTDIVREGDRIEIYRPLIIDPKEARRAKAKALSKKK
ncbi:MAG: RnfH family protein [Gammaproteobacteria bacterium]|nr:MAG: RnfH family protein [Gammaproteobacteria bacterium]